MIGYENNFIRDENKFSHSKLADFWIIRASTWLLPFTPTFRPRSPHENVQHDPKKIDFIKTVILSFIYNLKIFGLHLNTKQWVTN